jgi:type I restriction enzyme S subunit
VTGNWENKKWGELATLEYGKGLRDYKTKKGKYRVYGTNGPIGWNDEPLCPFPSIIIGRKGAYRGIHYSDEPFFVIDTAFYLNPKKNFNMKWAYYELLTHDINSMDSGSAIPSTSRESFYQLPVKLPPFPEQRAIAHILGTLDDKIELNRRMNETLESIARAIFKSWFVDFDPVHAKAEGRDPGLPPEISNLFPDSFEDSELGRIPKGWEVGKIGEKVIVTDYVANGSFASLKKNVNIYDRKNYALYVRTTDYKKGWSGNYKYTDRFSYDFLKKSFLSNKDFIISNVGDTGTVFRPPSWLDMPMTLGSNAITIKNEFYSSYLYYFFLSNIGQEKISSLVSGSAQPKFNKTDFRSIGFLMPSEKIIHLFNKYDESLHEKYIVNMKEIEYLSLLKNILLPRLISGELSIKNAEKIIEDKA